MESSQLFPTICLGLQCAAVTTFICFKNLAPPSSGEFSFPPLFQVDRKEGRWVGLAPGIVGPKTTTLSKVYSYTLNINRIFI